MLFYICVPGLAKSVWFFIDGLITSLMVVTNDPSLGITDQNHWSACVQKLVSTKSTKLREARKPRFY